MHRATSSRSENVEHVRVEVSDGCAGKLCNGRKYVGNISMLDLKRAYLQINVAGEQWIHQVVSVRGRCYYLTRLGFGLICAPKIMDTTVKRVLALDQSIESATDHHVHDIIVNEDIVSAADASVHLAACGLICKPPSRLLESQVVGLQLKADANGQAVWVRGNHITVVLAYYV